MKIQNNHELKEAFRKLNTLIIKGFEGQAEKEIEFKEIALAIEQYEDSVLKIMPLTMF